MLKTPGLIVLPLWWFLQTGHCMWLTWETSELELYAATNHQLVCILIPHTHKVCILMLFPASLYLGKPKIFKKAKNYVERNTYFPA